MNARQERFSIANIQQAKGNTPLVCLTAYSAPFAKILDPHVDVLLVGDSLGMALYGMENTRSVTVDMMINHGKAVVHASKQALVVVDLPFGSYENSPEQALETAKKVMAATNAQAVKLEGGQAMASSIKLLTEHDIPVMAHIGLLPQHITSKDGFRYQGRDHASAEQIMQDAIAIEEAGAFSVVIEAVTESLAHDITTKLSIPTIGIGASATCDGQILVTEDMAGLFTDFKPKFVRRFGTLANALDEAAQHYASNVKARSFPAEKEVVKGTYKS